VSVCRSTRASVAAGDALAPEQERHLFKCRRCRRATRAERLLGRLPDLAEAPPPSSGFASSVLAKLDPPRALGRSCFRRSVRWAAAIALFALAAGAGWRMEEQAEVRTSDLARTGLGLPDSSETVPIGL
jgi:hypothetical protein